LLTEQLVCLGEQVIHLVHDLGRTGEQGGKADITHRDHREFMAGFQNYRVMQAGITAQVDYGYAGNALEGQAGEGSAVHRSGSWSLYRY